MESQILSLEAHDWQGVRPEPEWTAALEAGKVLFFPHLRFELEPAEAALLRPEVRDPKSRNISLGVDDRHKGAAGDEATQAAVARMVRRFRTQAHALIEGLLPEYVPKLPEEQRSAGSAAGRGWPAPGQRDDD